MEAVSALPSPAPELSSAQRAALFGTARLGKRCLGAVAVGFCLLASGQAAVAHADIGSLKLSRGRPDPSPGAEVQVSGLSQALFKAAPGAVLKESCPGRVMTQNTRPGFPGSCSLPGRSSL